MNIALRDQVEDVITGFKGTVIARSEWLNGCVQFARRGTGCSVDRLAAVEGNQSVQGRVIGFATGRRANERCTHLLNTSHDIDLYRYSGVPVGQSHIRVIRTANQR
jgi:hypothetical protein